MTHWRWGYAGWIWVEAWLTVPWLANYLPMPAPLGHVWVWSKVWGMLVMPALVTLVALIPDWVPVRNRGHSPWPSFMLLTLGMVWQTQYLLHQAPPHLWTSLTERWIAAACCVVSLTLSLASPRENAPPALEICASAALVLTFVARAPWAIGISLVMLGTTYAILRRQPSRN